MEAVFSTTNPHMATCCGVPLCLVLPRSPRAPSEVLLHMPQGPSGEVTSEVLLHMPQGPSGEVTNEVLLHMPQGPSGEVTIVLNDEASRNTR